MYEKEFTIKAKGYAVQQEIAQQIKNKVYVEVPKEWLGRNIICISGSDIQRIA